MSWLFSSALVESYERTKILSELWKRVLAEEEGASLLLEIMHWINQRCEGQARDGGESSNREPKEANQQGWVPDGVCGWSSIRRREENDCRTCSSEGTRTRSKDSAWGVCPPQRWEQVEQLIRQFGVNDVQRSLKNALDRVSENKETDRWKVCVNSRCLLVLVEEFLEAKSLDGEPCAQLNVMPTPAKFLYKDKTMEASSFSRFGLTCELLTEIRGEELLTWFRAGFHAKTSAKLEEAQESPANAQDSGQKWQESFAKYDPATSLWKTSQLSLIEDLESCLETFPKWGSMRSGELYQRPEWVPPFPERECGLLRAPISSDGAAWKRNKPGDCQTSIAKTLNRGGRFRVIYGFIYAGYSPIQSADLCETMMGWPQGWTDLRPLETVKFPCKPLPLGESYPKDLKEDAS